MKVYKNFHIAGLEYYDALFVIKNIQAGDKLKLVVEKNNIYDENAVEIYYKGYKLGYVPRSANYSISQTLKNGWNIYETFAQRVDKKNLKIDVAIFIKKRKQ